VITLPPPVTRDGQPITFDQATGQTNILFRKRAAQSNHMTAEEAEAVAHELDPGESQIERLARDIRLKESGWSVTRNVVSVGGCERINYGYLPCSKPTGMTDDERADQWEREAQEMHRRQRTLSLAEKPRDTTGLREKRRGTMETTRAD